MLSSLQWRSVFEGAKPWKKRRKVYRNTKEKGDALELRVVRLLERQGWQDIRRNVRVKDVLGRKSEIDVVAKGMFGSQLVVECKHYSDSCPVPLSDVAKFAAVLKMNKFQHRNAWFVTTSRFSPRCSSVGVKCIDGPALSILEQHSHYVRMQALFLRGIIIAAMLCLAVLSWKAVTLPCCDGEPLFHVRPGPHPRATVM